GASVELRNEQLVVLGERVGDAEATVVEVEALLGLGEYPFGIHVLRQRGAAVDPQRDGDLLAAVRGGNRTGVLVAPLPVRARNQCDEVGGDGSRRLEHPPQRTAVATVA